MDKIKKYISKLNINKLSMPAVILIASVIIGGFFYGSQLSKQKSIERQQEIKLQADKIVEEAKAEQVKKEYIAKRKVDCLAIYKTESDKFNNIRSWNYLEPRIKPLDNPFLDILLESDKCEIIYENNKYNERICNDRLTEIKTEIKSDSENKDLNLRAFTTECNETFSNYF